MNRFPLLVLAGWLLVTPMVNAQGKFVANYDESKIPAYTLPDPLVTNSGDRVTDAAMWASDRRPELLQQFATQVYGTAPPPCEISHQLVSTKKDAIDGKAIRREVDVRFGQADDAPTMRLLIYTPKVSEAAVPAFLTLNFQGNHTIDPDPTIHLNANWVRSRNGTVKNNQSTEAGSWCGGKPVAGRNDHRPWLRIGDDLLWRHRPRF